MAHYKAEQDDWLLVYLKYLLFVFNFFFWVGGAAVMAVGVWTLVEKSGYLSVLASSTFAASAYILIFAGALVMVTGFLGFCAIVREDRSCLSAYFCLLLVIFLVELVAGVLAHMYYQRLSDELKQHLTRTLAENYRQPGAADITTSVDRLQQDFKCCGSNSSADWQHSAYILSQEAEGRRVPDSCCKTVVARCGQRAHPSNIYKVEPRLLHAGVRDLPLPYREAASASWSSSWLTTCCSWGQWASGWPVCRSAGWFSPVAYTGGSSCIFTNGRPRSPLTAPHKDRCPNPIFQACRVSISSPRNSQKLPLLFPAPLDPPSAQDYGSCDSHPGRGDPSCVETTTSTPYQAWGSCGRQEGDNQTLHSLPAPEPRMKV
ncbi:tetraspanin-11 isoform X1 [Prionailurus viverrinus]|uniref:tetraspanin-11 isoform X1 n=1 Tax=Prionailurus viverrinus TaxID=61388 RepID=UPI001FF49164|nr:tetraspanin-11 isoform X1 [Prionailurus viverrinus]